MKKHNSFYGCIDRVNQTIDITLIRLHNECIEQVKLYLLNSFVHATCYCATLILLTLREEHCRRVLFKNIAVELHFNTHSLYFVVFTMLFGRLSDLRKYGNG